MSLATNGIFRIRYTPHPKGLQGKPSTSTYVAKNRQCHRQTDGKRTTNDMLCLLLVQRGKRRRRRELELSCGVGFSCLGLFIWLCVCVSVGKFMISNWAWRAAYGGSWARRVGEREYVEEVIWETKALSCFGKPPTLQQLCPVCPTLASLSALRAWLAAHFHSEFPAAACAALFRMYSSRAWLPRRPLKPVAVSFPCQSVVSFCFLFSFHWALHC